MNKIFSKVSLIVSFIIFLSNASCISKVSQNSKTLQSDNDIVLKITQILNKNYVDKAIANNISEHLLANQKLGKYDSLTGKTLLSTLNLDIHSIHNDRHIQLINSKGSKKLPWNKSFILDVKIMEGNIGYLRFLNFPQPNKEAFGAIAAAFNLFQTSDAIIIDLRNNGGGHPDIVSNILGYFLESGVKYDAFHIPSQNKTFNYTSHKKVIGTKLLNKPLSILVNEKTGSSAELLAFAFQNLDLGKVYGTTTMGLVNLSGYYPINDTISLLASKGLQQNPFNSDGLENIGVIPDFSYEGNKSLLNAHLDHIEVLHGKDIKQWISSNLAAKKDDIDISKLIDYAGNYDENITISLKDKTLYYQDARAIPYEMIALNDFTFSLKSNFDDRFRLIFKKEGETNFLIKKYFDGTENKILKGK